jgi:hypothetical protein
MRDVNPSLANADAKLHVYLGYFFHSPVKIIKTTVIRATNTSLSNPLTWEALLRFLGGLILLMTTSQARCCKEGILGERFSVLHPFVCTCT